MKTYTLIACLLFVVGTGRMLANPGSGTLTLVEGQPGFNTLNVTVSATAGGFTASDTRTTTATGSINVWFDANPATGATTDMTITGGDFAMTDMQFELIALFFFPVADITTANMRGTAFTPPPTPGPVSATANGGIFDATLHRVRINQGSITGAITATDPDTPINSSFAENPVEGSGTGNGTITMIPGASSPGQRTMQVTFEMPVDFTDSQNLDGTPVTVRVWGTIRATGEVILQTDSIWDAGIWDAGNTANGATIDPASGNWNTTAGNIVWNDAGVNRIWDQAGTTSASHAAIFGGADAAVDSYDVTLASQMAALSLTFNNTGYELAGSTLWVAPTSGGATIITVAGGKTATINSALTSRTSSEQTVVINSGGTLNLGGNISSFRSILGGTSAANGAGTLNITGGTSTLQNPRFNVATMNQTGGSVSLGGSSGSGNWIGYSAAKNVNYTITGGSLNLTGGSGAYLGIGRSMSANTATLTVKTGGTVNFGNTGDGNLHINLDGSATTAKLDVQGGDLTVGTGATANVLSFFWGGAPASKNALMTQSGGNVTANGIQFGSSTANTVNSAVATLQLSGGNLYVGALGIVKPVTPTNLVQVTIQLQGGTLGASANWSSSLDMKLGTTGGGVTIKAADAANVARNITLSGSIGNDTAVNGPLTKTGSGTLTLASSNSYSGATAVNAGTLAITDNNALGTTAGATTINGGNGSSANNLSLSSATTDLTIAENLNFYGNGAGRAQLINNSAQNHTLTGNIDVSSDTNLVQFQALGAGSITLSGDITGTLANGAVLFLRGNTPSTNNAVTGNITLSGGSLAKTDTGTWTVGALGKTISAPGLLVANGILKMGAANVLVPSPVVSMGNTSGGSTGSWDLNGFDQTIAGIIQNGTSGIKPITSSTGMPVLTVDNATDYTTGTLIPLTGALGLTKQGAGKLTLAAANTYTGPTIISAGTLLVNGSLAAGSAVTVATNATLGGNGTVGGAVTNNAGGTLSPGTSIGTLTLNGNLTLKAGSTNTFEVDGSAPANDQVVLAGTVNYGGVLNIVTNGTFTAGQTFKLFSGAGATNVGNFASLVGSPGGGKAFSFTNGVLTVVTAAPSGSATLTNSVSGGVLSLAWSAGQGWRLEYQTNALTVGLGTNWVEAANSSVSSTNIIIDSTKPTVFYRLVYP